VSQTLREYIIWTIKSTGISTTDLYTMLPEPPYELEVEKMDDKVRELYRTIGSAMWLDGLTDEEFDAIWNDCLPWLIREGDRRGKDTANLPFIARMVSGSSPLLGMVDDLGIKAEDVLARMEAMEREGDDE
jgi:hypothetical protein